MNNHSFNTFTSLCGFILLLLLSACTNHPSVPSDAAKVNKTPTIQPDYTEVMVPPNIAPLNFKVLENSEECVARFTSSDGKSYSYGVENKILIDEDEWKDMLEASKAKSIKVEVFANVDGVWKAFTPFDIHVAQEEIDPYISYRLISPSYVAYEMLSINQRNITNFDEKEIYNNMIISGESDGQCINCHAYQNYHTDNMQFHMRQGHGGTMIVHNGVPTKVNLKTDSTISAGVYPAWHPTLPYIAYSVNSTGQSFHTKDKAKIEVEDSKSDIIFYDVEKNEVSIIEDDSVEFECFPTWSPDGKTLYYGSAHFEFTDTTAHETQAINRYKEIKYNIYSKSFNPQTKAFGPRVLVYDAAAIGQSATFPRVSPDGRYILFAQGDHGCFHVWHPDADLYVYDLKQGKAHKLQNANSSEAESFHNWSSNGRWMIFISRRDDGNYSRLYMSYFDKNGKDYKAFELPQRDPSFYDFFIRSYNVPEFMVEPVAISAQTFASIARKDAKTASFAGRK